MSFFGSEASHVDYEETVNSYHSDEGAAGADSPSTSEDDNGSQFSLPVTNPQALVSTSESNTLPGSMPAVPSSTLILKMEDGEHTGNAEIDFVKTRLDILAKGILPARATGRGELLEDLSAVHFCRHGIRVLHQNKLGLKQHLESKPSKVNIIDGHCRQIERLRLEILKSKMEAEIARTQATVLNTYTYRTAQAVLAEERFVRYKTHAVGQETFNSRVEAHLYRDSASLLAEVVRSCTGPQASADEIWKAVRRRMGTRGEDV